MRPVHEFTADGSSSTLDIMLPCLRLDDDQSVKMNSI